VTRSIRSLATTIPLALLLVLLTAAGAFASAPVVAAVAAGNGHTCAVVDGGADCWGASASGQRGDGTTAPAVSAKEVQSLGVGVIAVGASFTHSCAIAAGGTAWCWGANGDGQLGDGTITNSLVPVAVSMPPAVSFTAITVGFRHSCAIDTGGGVWCWGYNGHGELGQGTVDGGVRQPQAVPTLGSGVTAISAGSTHTCAIDTGAVVCWGDNLYGQIGDGNKPTMATTPTAVAAGSLASGALAIASGTGSHTCAIDSTGKVWCWGRNADGQLGNNSTTGTSAPVAVFSGALGEDVTQIAVGAFHSCAIDQTGKAWCWGANFTQQLGDGGYSSAQVPQAVAGLSSGVTLIAAGGSHTCALQSAKLHCWGYNDSGQLGVGDTAMRGTATPVVWAPTLSVSAPNDDSTTLDTTATVTFDAGGWPLPLCTVNGEAAAGTATVDLALGPNTISVSCANAGGSATTVLTVTRNAPPSIGTLSTDTGPTTQAEQTSVQWTVSGHPVPTCTVNGVAATSPRDFPLAPGPNSIALECTNVLGSDDQTVQVTRNTTPQLTLTAPVDNLRTTAAQVDIAFTTTGYPAPGCTVGGNAATSPQPVGLSAGNNTFTVRCSNAAGADEQTLHIWRGAAPGVLIDSPGDGDNTTDAAQPVFFAASGDPAPECKFGDDVATSGFAAPLVAGSNEITVTCTNEFGSASQSVTVFRGVAGSLTIDSPADGYATTAATVDVAFSPTGTPLPTCTYLGLPASSPLSVALDGPGPRTVSIHCGNWAGGETKQITVHRTEAPQAHISLPPEGPVVDTATATIPFWSTGHPVPDCKINGVDVAGSPANVPLEPGDNELELSCTNGLGTSTDTVTVTRNLAPQVTIIAPAAGSATLDAAVEVVFSVEAHPAPVCSVNGPAVAGDRATIDLMRGANPIEVRCANAAGSGSAGVNIFRHSPLAVTVSAPADGATTYGERIGVAYTVNGGALVPPGTTCTVGGAPSSGPGGDTVALLPGANTVTVTCSNPLAAASASVTITRALPPAPLLRSAPKSARAGSAIRFEAVCFSACRITPSLRIGGKRVKGLKANVAAAGATMVTLKLPAKVTQRIRAALKRRRTTAIALTLTPRSAEGAGAAVTVRIR
jgi:alpha-tubulin suppressor-like RCC1 family protein